MATLGLVAALLPAAAVGDPPRYTIINLGTLGGSEAEPNDVNDAGVVVGWSYVSGSTAKHAFMWNEQEGMADLGSLGGAAAEALGVNNLGEIVGWAEDAEYHRLAFLWLPVPNYGLESGMHALTELGEPPPGTGVEEAHDINDAGQVVGGAETFGSAGFVWQAGSWTLLDPGWHQPGELWWYEPKAINTQGHVVGEWRVGNPPLFRNAGTYWWSESEGFISMTPVAGPGDRAYVFDINDHDQTIALGGIAPPTAYWYLWDNGTVTQLLLSCGANYPYGINNALQCVAGDGPGPYAGGSLWNGGSCYALEDLLAPGSDWYFSENDGTARAINNHGQIVGTGYYLPADEYRPFLMTSDCNTNGVPDTDDITGGTSPDCNNDGIPDECSGDCNTNGVWDACDIYGGTSADCQPNQVPDECDIAAGTSLDLDTNGMPDECAACVNNEDCADGHYCNGAEICSNGICLPGEFIDCDDSVGCTVDWCDEVGDSCVNAASNGLCDDGLFCDGAETCDALLDCQAGPPPCAPAEVCNEVADTCEPDCNTNGVPDSNDISGGTSADCNSNAIPDTCDLAVGNSTDINGNDVPDDCESCVAPPGTGDADSNGVVDLEDYALMALCLSGPGVWVTPPCDTMDMDGDCEVDLTDYGGLQRAFVKPAYPTHLIPTDDTFIDRTRPTQVLGGSVQLQVRNDDGGYPGFEIDTLIRFGLDDIPMGTSIGSATMYMYYYDWEDTDPAGRTHRCHRVEEAWDESAATWDNRPTWSSVISAEATVPNSPGQWMSWDVTADVQDFIDGTAANRGWVLRDEQDWGFSNIPYTRSRSKEYGVNVPYLEIVYAPPAPEACCLPNGGCVDLVPHACVATNGLSLGRGTTCATDPCPEACCLPDGSCTDIAPSECAGSNGIAQGPGTDCAEVEPCPQPEACCFNDGSCRDLLSDACLNSNGAAQGTGTDCLSTSCPVLEACCYYDPGPTCQEESDDDCAAAGGIPQGAGTGCGGGCPPAVPDIIAVGSLATHGLGVGELAIAITPTSKVEPRESGVTLVEVTFGAPMDPLTCEDTGNIAIVGVRSGAQVASSAVLYPANTLRIGMAALPDGDCYEFDLTGMLTADLTPVGNPTFAIVALRGDVDENLLVTLADSSLINPHWGDTPSEGSGTARYDYDVSGLIDPADTGTVQQQLGHDSPNCL